MYCTQEARFTKNFQVIDYSVLFLRINPTAGLKVKKPVSGLCDIPAQS